MEYTNFIPRETLDLLEFNYNVYIDYIDWDYDESYYDTANYSTAIMLFKYSSINREAICICHEIAHLRIERAFKGEFFLCKIALEGAVWHETINIMKECESLLNVKFDFRYIGEDYKFMRKCLNTYISNKEYKKELKK